MDITRDVFMFCDARRHLWNTYFADHIGSIMDKRVDAFLEIQKLLFSALVLEECKKGDYEPVAFGTEPIDFLRVNIFPEADQLSVLVARSRNPTQWVEETLRSDQWGSKSLLFIDFFDWYPQDPMGRCSYPFVEVEVRAKPGERSEERWLLRNEYISIHCISGES